MRVVLAKQPRGEDAVDEPLSGTPLAQASIIHRPLPLSIAAPRLCSGTTAHTSKMTPAAINTLLTMATLWFFGSTAHTIRIVKVTRRAMHNAKQNTLGLKVRPCARLCRYMVMCVPAIPR
jgi:hypothetical protein